MSRMECEDAPQLMPELTKSLFLIVSGRSDDDIERGWDNLRKLEDSGLLQGSVSLADAQPIMRGILRGSVMNPHEVPKLMAYFAKYVKKKSADGPPDEDFDLSDYVAFVQLTSSRDVALLTSMVEILRDHPVYRSTAGGNARACRAIVASLGSFPMPIKLAEMSKFRDNVTRIREALRVICKSSNGFGNSDLITVCLQTVDSMISDTERTSHPGPGLIAVLELVEDRLISPAVKWIMRMETRSDSQLERALEVLCNWFHRWLKVEHLSIWIMGFISGLEARKKYDILMRVCNAGYVKKLLSCVQLPMASEQATLLATIILCKQPTRGIFHENINTIKTVFAVLKKLDTEVSLKCQRSLVDVTKALVERFPGYSFYESLENAFPVAPDMEKVAMLRDERVWSDYDERFPCPEINVVPPNDHGKVGLTNLGNTCYMNSVLQALAMTRQFSQEVMRHKSSFPSAEDGGSAWVASAEEAASIMPKLQNLFALLSYSRRRSLSPTEILAASRPEYFTPGQQQDSSEFLCHLLDVLYEQEKSLSRQTASATEVTSGASGKGKRSSDVMSPDRGVIKRWTTEEDLSEGISLERKTSQSLGDFPQSGEDEEQLGQTQPGESLSDCHSDSTDSGIQSVDGCGTSGGGGGGGSGVGSSSSSSGSGNGGTIDESASSQSILVHRVFGGESEITYQCAQCDTSSHNTDRFRDLQLCFPQEIADNQDVSVQDLMNYYLTPEKLTGDNKYRCDRCTKLCDAQRIIKILRAPIHLILTLKHFHYDPETRLRTKLRHKVTYNETIRLPVSQSEPQSSSPIAETYRLYAAVVHSGYSMDYGHYITYARDAKQNWYKFNDSWVSRTSLEDFNGLEPPDTPYILFYEKTTPGEAADVDEETAAKPELSTLSKHIQELVERDARAYDEESRHQADKKRSQRTSPGGGRLIAPLLRRHDNSDDENPPPSSCRGPIDIPANRFLF